MKSLYDVLMGETSAHIEIYLDVEKPIELVDFVSAFTALSGQYERYMRDHHPDLKNEAQIFIQENRPGSILADLIPLFGSLMGIMDQAVIVRDFVQLFGKNISQYFRTGGRLKDASKGELKDLIGSLSAIANDPNGRGQIRAVTYKDGNRQVEATIESNTPQAQQAIKEIESHKKELDEISSADYERVLMTFKRSDVGDADVGKRSGERVIIEEISEKDLALIYAASLAEEKIKDQMRHTNENIYHKRFVVDVNVEMHSGKSVAYKVINLHQIIDLPPED